MRLAPSARFVVLITVGCTAAPEPTAGAGAPRALSPSPGAVTVSSASAAVAPAEDLCSRLPECAGSGRCQSEGGECVAKTDADCSTSDSDLGLSPSACERGDCVARDGECWQAAKTDADCNVAGASGESVCKAWGLCKAVDGVCHAVDPAKCPNDGNGPWRIEKGKCVRDGARCAATCEKTKRCYFDRQFQICREPPTKDEDCAYECVVGRCTARGGACVVASEADCQKGACAVLGLCKVGVDQCVATPEGCLASSECKDGGVQKKCSVVGDSCEFIRPPR